VILRRLEGENVALAVDWQYHKIQEDSSKCNCKEKKRLRTYRQISLANIYIGNIFNSQSTVVTDIRVSLLTEFMLMKVC